MSLSPAFIVGSPRSGTSILVGSLLLSGYSGYNEGNFLSILRTLDRDIDRHLDVFATAAPKLLAARVDRAGLKRRVLEVITDEAVRHQTSQTWVDKTGGPGMIESIPALRTVFPDSRYIFAKRRGIENIVSRLKKFPRNDFEFHCTGWARTMTAWRELMRDHPGSDCIAIDQRDISQQPETVARHVGDHLGMAAPQIASLAKAYTKLRPQQTEDGSADRVLNLSALGWSDTQLAIFHRVCGEEMTLYGYTDDETYWRH